MKLPAVQHPERYACLYVYDFGTHVSIGYTGGEIVTLRESKAHRKGTAYQIYRVTEDLGFELRGVLDERLTASEALCFLRNDGKAARRDYDEIRSSADRDPLGCPAELHLARLYDFDPPNVTAVSYPASAAVVMSDWLTRSAPSAGDVVIGGFEAYSTLIGSDGIRISSCALPTLIDYADRPADEVLAAVNQPVQR